MRWQRQCRLGIEIPNDLRFCGNDSRPFLVCVVEFDQQIQMGDTSISSGDLMVGDADGVFILNPDIAHLHLEQFQQMEIQERQKRDQFFSEHSAQDYYHFTASA